MKIGLRDVEYFAVVAQHGHVGRAAEALGLSQPALSRSLRRLEASMDARLVARTPKGVELTAVGAALFSRVHRLRMAVDDVLREAADLSQGTAGHLRLGLGPVVAEHMLPRASTALFKSAPRATVKMTVAHHHVLVPGLRNGQFDLILSGIPAPEHEDLTHDYLYDDEFAVVVSTDHRLAGRKQVTLTDLANERWVSSSGNILWQSLERAFEQSDLPPPQIALDAGATLLALQVVASTELVGFASRQVLRKARPRLRAVELKIKGHAWIRRVGISYRKDAYLAPAALRFIQILKSTAKEIASE